MTESLRPSRERDVHRRIWPERACPAVTFSHLMSVEVFDQFEASTFEIAGKLQWIETRHERFS
jgi:hypothetical protein